MEKIKSDTKQKPTNFVSFKNVIQMLYIVVGIGVALFGDYLFPNYTIAIQVSILMVLLGTYNVSYIPEKGFHALSRIATLGVCSINFSILIILTQMLFKSIEIIQFNVFGCVFLASALMTFVVAANSFYKCWFMKEYVDISNRIYTLKVTFLPLLVAMVFLGGIGSSLEGITYLSNLFKAVPWFYNFLCIVIPAMYLFEIRLDHETDSLDYKQYFKRPLRLTDLDAVVK